MYDGFVVPLQLGCRSLHDAVAVGNTVWNDFYRNRNMRIINKIGNEELLNREKSLFLCSKHAPYSVYDKVRSTSKIKTVLKSL